MTVLKFPLSPLGRVLDEHRRALKCSKQALTVLSDKNDPFRADTRRVAAEWFAAQYERFYGPNRTCHLRGAHYRVVVVGNILKPDGEVYVNTEGDWNWLNAASMAARYIGLVPMDRIVDHGGGDPVIIQRTPIVECLTDIDPTFQLWKVDADSDIGIDPKITGFDARQPYMMAVFGEKSSLDEVLRPICERVQADLYLPRGEISLTHVYEMAKRSVDEQRPLVLFTVTDCDPSGYQMPVSLGRKLQALKHGCLPQLEYIMPKPIALTPQQAEAFDLPSTPLKDTEKRADKWLERWGREQTEVDSMLELRPSELRTMINEAIEPYFDATLASRVFEARGEWQDEAQEWIDNAIGDELEALREKANELLGPYNENIDNLRRRHGELVEGITELPDPEIPEAELDAPVDEDILIDSRWTWLRQTQALKDRKAYVVDDNGGGGDLDEAA